SVLLTEIDDLGSTLFVGDSLYLSRDLSHLSTMYSYPNVIPLSNSETMRVFSRLQDLDFAALFGAFPHQNIYQGAKEVFDRSLARYQLVMRS
ncbi:MAG: hypothetical protein HKN76_18620, partial [Saprospiraceae bacterium]|nr:hypothetical protein [Saprospiraceae bacterium]